MTGRLQIWVTRGYEIQAGIEIALFNLNSAGEQDGNSGKS